MKGLALLAVLYLLFRKPPPVAAAEEKPGSDDGADPDVTPGRSLPEFMGDDAPTRPADPLDAVRYPGTDTIGPGPRHPVTNPADRVFPELTSVGPGGPTNRDQLSAAGDAYALITGSAYPAFLQQRANAQNLRAYQNRAAKSRAGLVQRKVNFHKRLLKKIF